MPGFLGETGAVVRRQHAVRLGAVREEHDRRRSTSRCAAGAAVSPCPVDRRVRSTPRPSASPIAVPYPGASDAMPVLEEAAVGRRRGDDDRVVGKGDEADLDAARARGSANEVIAARAASSRLGATSVATIEYDTSTTSTTVARSEVVSIGTRGRATATQSSATAPSRRPAITMAAPARAGRDRGEHGEVRERDRGPRRPPLEPQVAGEREQRHARASRAGTGSAKVIGHSSALAQTARTCTSAWVPAAAVAVTRATTRPRRPCCAARWTAPRCSADGEAAWRNAIAVRRRRGAAPMPGTTARTVFDCAANR